MPVRENGEGVKGRLPEPSDRNVSLTQRGKEGKKVGRRSETAVPL